MSTLTLATIRSLIRSDLNEGSTTILSDAELNTIINDGYKDAATKGLCYESKIAKNNIATEKIIFLGNTVIRVNYVEYKTGTTEGGIGMLCAFPQTIGYTTIESCPKYWFQWGQYLIIEPLPDVATYDLAVYATCYPAAVLSADSDTLSSLPVEFHECVYLFALSAAALKLRRWGDYALSYNKYISSVQQKRAEYIMKYPDSRASHELPDNVSPQQQKG
jgi:hypothetical protein